MKNKNYRELHFTSSQLVFVFLAILVLGIFIFLLGISVGKKQVQLSASSEIGTKMKAEVAKSPPQQEELKPEVKAPAHAEKEKPIQTKPGLALKPEAEKPKGQVIPPSVKSLYYIQVGAFAEREVAQSFAKTFEKEGYPVRVLEPFPSDKKPVFRVRLGGYETQDEAVKVKTKLISSSPQKKSDYFIVKG